MSQFTFYITDDGRLPDGIKETLKRVIPELSGKKVKLSIAEAKEKRSLQQNDYYWAVIVPHVRKVRFDNGDPMSEDEVHEDLLIEYAPRVKAKRLDGSFYMRPKRSKEMSVEEMANYITTIVAAMAQFGEPVPESH